jgi:uncharacterized protein
MISLTQSRYNVITPLAKGRALAHNTMSNATALLEPAELATLLRPGQRYNATDPRIRNLVYGGFLKRSDVDERAAVRQEFERRRFDPSGMILTIAPTLACNFGCDYCFQGTNKPIAKMSQEVQDAIIDLIVEAATGLRRLHVAWYGGEPLLGLNIIETMSDRLLDLCRAKAITYDSMIVSNGYRLTANVARSLYSRGVKLAQITLDGAAEYHDDRRTTLAGKGTFGRIVMNLRNVVQSSELRIVVRINIDVRNSGDISRLLHQLVDLGFAKRKNFGVYFAPVEAITEGCHASSELCMTKADYTKLETALHQEAFDLGLAQLPYPRGFRGLCSAIKPKGYVLTPTGDVHKCWDTVSMPHLRVGSVFNRAALQTDPRVQQWLQWSPFDNAVCRDCKLLPHCTGSCAHKFLNPEQTLGEAASLPCPAWKYQLKERLVMLAMKTGMICSDDIDPAEVVTDPAEICTHVNVFPQKQNSTVSVSRADHALSC